jgi:hypothetical protein
MVGLLPSATTCKPCATTAAASADAGDAESSAGACLYVSAREAKGCLRDVPASCSSSSRYLRTVASRYFRVGPKDVWCRTEDV